MHTAGNGDERWPDRLRALAVEVPEDATRAGVAARAVLWAVIVYWTLRVARLPLDGSESPWLLHSINLVFHEAGHVVFSPFGGFLTALGGSLLQVIVPLVCAGTLLVRTRDPFGAALCLWWAGENLVDLAPYIADARALQLELLGGGTGHEVEGHDWEAVLGTLGLLRHDVRLGKLAHALGVLVMIGAAAWALLVLKRQHEAALRNG